MRAAIGWLDTWALSKGVKDSECAHQWVNHYLNGETGPAMTAKNGYGNTTNESPDWITPTSWCGSVRLRTSTAG